MAILSYGAVSGGARRVTPLWSNKACTQVAVATTSLLVLVAVACVRFAATPLHRAVVELAQMQTHARQAHLSELLGFDPLRSNTRTRPSPNTFESFEKDPNDQDPLPTWAIEWNDDVRTKCKVGAQCDQGNTMNPLGELGRWVMIRTTPHYNTAYDYYRRHKCENLPGWALEECHRARNHEHYLDANGNYVKGGREREFVLSHKSTKDRGEGEASWE
jgi:hypothetical protein